MTLLTYSYLRYYSQTSVHTICDCLNPHAFGQPHRLGGRCSLSHCGTLCTAAPW